MNQTVILGAGLAGLSCSYHLGHKRCILFDKNSYAGGHAYSHLRQGFTWDEGPHVSFTKHAYVRKLLEESCSSAFLEFECNVSNYYQGSWIPHPAQSNLFAVPEPKRSECLHDFLRTRDRGSSPEKPMHYGEWLSRAFGEEFSQTFPSAYTRKYWTCDPKDLATDWVGDRVYYPDVEIVLAGSKKPPKTKTHYMTSIRYPAQGGFFTFAKILARGANLRVNQRVSTISLKDKIVRFASGDIVSFDRLISTMPLPELINLIDEAPKDVLEAAASLRCSSLLLVNVTALHSALKPYHWMYIYDENMLSTRVTTTELLAPSNAPSSKTGIQVEVYESPYRPFEASHAEIAQLIVKELQVMGLLEMPETVHTQYIPYANIIFDHKRRPAQEIILSWLEQFGLAREGQDLDPMTDWSSVQSIENGSLMLAGRFGQWKYFWSDDCILRGHQIASSL